MPIQNSVRISGRCGRREWESRREVRGIISFERSRVATVKGILVFGKAALFAGLRRNADLGRSDLFRGFLPRRRRAGDSGCPEGAEEGNAVAHAP